MHIDLDAPHEMYVVAALSKKVPLGEHTTWVEQDEYTWLTGVPPYPFAGQCWHAYMIARLDQFRQWLLEEHTQAAKDRKDTEIRPEICVSFPFEPEVAG